MGSVVAALFLLTFHLKKVVGRHETFTGNKGQMTQESGGIREMLKRRRVAPAKGARGEPSPCRGLGGQSLPRGGSLVCCQKALAGKERERAGVHSLPLVKCGG